MVNSNDMNNCKALVLLARFPLGRHLKVSFISAVSIFLSIASTSCSRSAGDSGQTADHIEKSDKLSNHGDLIEFDDHLAGHFGVETLKISPSDFSEIIPVSGQIETKSSDEAVATATRSGILTLSPDVNNGSLVSRGTSIGSINAAGVQGGDPALQARALCNAAKRELDRLTPLHKDGIVSDEVYNAALRSYEEALAALRSSTQGSAAVTAPKAGVITQLLARSGEYVEAGQKIAVISGNTSLTLRADLPEKYINEIQKIETANFRAASSDMVLSIDQLEGRMISNAGTAVSSDGYIPIYFTFKNNGGVAPGAFAEIYLKGAARHDVLSVPKDAIVETSGNKCVYTAEGGGHYAKHVVSTGATDGQNVEILSGLQANENVVVKGAHIIRMAETSSTAVPGHTHNH